MVRVCRFRWLSNVAELNGDGLELWDVYQATGTLNHDPEHEIYTDAVDFNLLKELKRLKNHRTDFEEKKGASSKHVMESSNRRITTYNRSFE